jgi:hypothetical protein
MQDALVIGEAGDLPAGDHQASPLEGWPRRKLSPLCAHLPDDPLGPTRAGRAGMAGHDLADAFDAVVAQRGRFAALVAGAHGTSVALAAPMSSGDIDPGSTPTASKGLAASRGIADFLRHRTQPARGAAENTGMKQPANSRRRPQLHPFTELLHALRQLRSLSDVFWDIAYGRTRLEHLWEGSDVWSPIEDQAIRVLLGLALVVPEPLLRAQLKRVTADRATAVDVAMLVQPLVEAQRLQTRDPASAWSAMLLSLVQA